MRNRRGAAIALAIASLAVGCGANVVFEDDGSSGGGGTGGAGDGGIGAGGGSVAGSSPVGGNPGQGGGAPLVEALCEELCEKLPTSSKAVQIAFRGVSRTSMTAASAKWRRTSNASSRTPTRNVTSAVIAARRTRRTRSARTRWNARRTDANRSWVGARASEPASTGPSRSSKNARPIRTAALTCAIATSKDSRLAVATRMSSSARSKRDAVSSRGSERAAVTPAGVARLFMAGLGAEPSAPIIPP